MQTDHPRRRRRPEPEPAAPSAQDWDKAMEKLQAKLQGLIDDCQQWWERASTACSKALLALEATPVSAEEDSPREGGRPQQAAAGIGPGERDAVSVLTAQVQELQEDCQKLAAARQKAFQQVQANGQGVKTYLVGQLQAQAPEQVAAQLQDSEAWQTMLTVPAEGELYHQVIDNAAAVAAKLGSLSSADGSQLELSEEVLGAVGAISGEAETAMSNGLVFDRIYDATRTLIPGTAPGQHIANGMHVPGGEHVPSGRPGLQGGELQARQSVTRAGHDEPRGVAVAGEFRRGPVPASSPLGPDSESSYGPAGPAE